MSIRKREDTGKYEVRIRMNGKQYSKSFNNKRIAEQHERKIISEIENGTFQKESKEILFGKASELYMKNVAYIHCKKSSINSYEGYLNNHILPALGSKKLCDISKIDCDKFIAGLSNKRCKGVSRTKDGNLLRNKTKKLSNETINHIIVLTKAIFEYFVDAEIIFKNPMKSIKKLKSTTPESAFLTIDECNKLIKVAKENYSLQDYVILYFSIVTGMRQGEVLALTWKDVDLKNGVISINKSYSKGIVSTPKTKNSIRNIKIPQKLIKVLREYKLSSVNSKYNLVFSNSEGNYLDCRNLVQRFFKPCLKKAQLKDITWHQLRHSCITAMAEENVSIKYIQKQAGHSSESTTLKIYTHATQNMETKAVKVLEDAFVC